MRQPAILILLCTLLLATSGTDSHIVVAPRPTKDYALFIAVNNYQNPKLLDFANPQGNPKKDAQEIEQLLKDQYGFSTERLNDPSAAEITAKLEQYERDFRSGAKDPNGQLFLFFSGHGEREYGNGFFLASDADPTKLYEKTIPYALWRPRIANFNCKHIMVVIDACYSGTFDPNWFNRPKSYGTRAGELDATAKLQANYDAKKTRMFFTSATEVQSPEVSSFAKKLKEGLLSGGGTDGILTSTELFSSLELSSPRPHRGEFEQDEAGSTFLFFSALPKPAVDPAADVRAWTDAKTTNTLEAYRAYLRNFAQGEFRELADSRVKVFEQKNTDYANWQKAKLANTRDAHERYLRENPNGDFRDLAEAVLKRLNTVANTQLDTDKDGVPDAADQCPNQFGPASNNGCPVPTSESSYDDPYVGRMVFVKGGTFQMGDANGESNEKPVHSIILNNFYIGKTEVTQAQWQAVMGNNPSSFKNCDQCPVESVSWNDAQEFINKLNAKTGKTYRLPTEAEWEYAARGGGKQTYTYAGSNTVDEVAWYTSNAEIKTHPVGQKKANELGLYDMSGNVREWCQDWYADDYYAKSPSSNPPGPSTGSFRVVRGGSWLGYPGFLRVASRIDGTPDFRVNVLGFRLARQQ